MWGLGCFRPIVGRRCSCFGESLFTFSRALLCSSAMRNCAITADQAWFAAGFGAVRWRRRREYEWLDRVKDMADTGRVCHMAAEAIRRSRRESVALLIGFHCRTGEFAGANLVSTWKVATRSSSSDSPCCAGHIVIVAHVSGRHHRTNTVVDRDDLSIGCGGCGI